MSLKKFKVLVYPSAERDLGEIKDYFERVLKTNPDSLFRKLLERFEVLETNPEAHPLVKDEYLARLGYRMIPVDNFIVFYIIEPGEAQIHRVLYGRRDYLRIL